jgi:hypothetical protein
MDGVEILLCPNEKQNKTKQNKTKNKKKRMKNNKCTRRKVVEVLTSARISQFLSLSVMGGGQNM